MSDALKTVIKFGLVAAGIALVTLFLLTGYLTISKQGIIDSGCEVRVTGEAIDLLIRCDQGLVIENAGDANVTVKKQSGAE